MRSSYSTRNLDLRGGRRPSLQRRSSATSNSQTETESNDLPRRHRPDYSIVVIMSILLVVGAVIVYAIGPGLTSGTNYSENYYSTKQMTAIILGVVAFLVSANIPIRSWQKLMIPIAIVASILAVAVRFLGEEIYGAHRWITFAGFSFQASELVKLAIVLWLASFLATNKVRGTMDKPRTLRIIGAVLLVVVFVVVGLQSDLGSAAVMMSIMGITSFVAGLPVKKILVIGGVIVAIAILAITSTPYRRSRVATFINPQADCQASGYQACQALITVGSGGLWGKGIGKSVQAYGYLPKPENDSIFAILGEKFGFIGSVTILVLFGFLFKKIAEIAEKAPSYYTKFLATGVLVWLSVQMLINVGAMVGLLPLKGITLPFISYGGTSIIFVLTAVGIVFQISRYTKIENTRVKTNPILKTGTGRV